MGDGFIEKQVNAILQIERNGARVKRIYHGIGNGRTAGAAHDNAWRDLKAQVRREYHHAGFHVRAFGYVTLRDERRKEQVQ